MVVKYQKLARNLLTYLSRIGYLLNILKNIYLVMDFGRMQLMLFKLWKNWMEVGADLGSNGCIKGTSKEFTKFRNHKLHPFGLNVQ